MKRIDFTNKLDVFLGLSGLLALFYWFGDSLTTAVYLYRSNIQLTIPLFEQSVSGLLMLIVVLLMLKGMATLVIVLVAVFLSNQEITEKVFKEYAPSIVKNTVNEMTSFSILFAFALYGIIETLLNIVLIAGYYVTPDMLNMMSNVLYLVVLGVIVDLLNIFKRS